MIKKPKILKNQLSPFEKIMLHTRKKMINDATKKMETMKRRNSILLQELKSMMPEKKIDSFPILRITLDALLEEGAEELYQYLQEHQGIEINCNKDYLKDRGVGNEFFSQEDDYLFIFIKREALKDENAFEKKMHNYFFPEFQIMYSHHSLN